MVVVRRSRYVRFILLVFLFATFVYYFSPWIGERRYETGMRGYIKSSFEWKDLPLQNPVSTFVPLPTSPPQSLPRIQHQFHLPSAEDLRISRERQVRVQATFLKCWNSYKSQAWMRDELTPLTGAGKDTFGGWAATMIDSLDTLFIMGLDAEFKLAVEAVATIDWSLTSSTACNIFETTIRHLGGLLSAYDLSQEKVLLMKAVELGDMLYAGFDTPNRMPPFWLDFEKAKTGVLVADDQQPSASPCSLSLEFTRLALLTGEERYYDAIARITDVMAQKQNVTRLPGMWPTFINMREMIFNQDTFTMGALADSMYEYLPKMHILLAGSSPVYEKLALFALDTISQNLLFRPMLPHGEDILFTGNVKVADKRPILDAEGQHLGCFAGGLFALSGKVFDKQGYVEIGEKLTKGCIFSYDAFPTGIMPEIFNMLACPSLEKCSWNQTLWENESVLGMPKGFISARVPFYALRPEAIESVFLMWRITGKKEYREAAWRMFEAIIEATETGFGNAAIADVTVQKSEVQRTDSMESFWMAETLKYFYLIFSEPELINLDEYVFNTEAHPLRRLR